MRILGGLVVLVGVLGTLQAQDTFWTDAGSGFWTNSASWSAGAPSNNPTVHIENAGNKTVTIDAATPAGNLTITNLNVVGMTAGATNTLYLSGNTNALNVLGNLFVAGGAVGRAGALVVDNGALVTTNNYSIVGGYYPGDGSVTVSNGQWLAQDVHLGFLGGSSGTLTISGGSNVFRKLFVGSTTKGAVAMSGGYLSTSGIYLGSNATTRGQGSFLLSSGGVLEVNTLVSGVNQSGVFTNQNGGVLQFATATPTITTNDLNSIVVTNAVIAYRNVNGVNIYQSSVSNITFQGNNAFRLNNSTNVSVVSYTFDTNSGPYQSLQLMGAAPTWQGTALTIGAGGALMVTNTMLARVNGLVTNSGTISVMNGAVVYGGNVINLGAYVSDPSTNTYNGNLTVGTNATVNPTAGDIYAFGSNFVMQSANRAFNMSTAIACFGNTNYGITTGTTNHTFDLAGSGAVDMGSNGFMSAVQLATNFSIGTLSIASNNNLIVTGSKTGSLTNALYVGWLDLSAWNTNAGPSLTNTLTAALTLSDINLYYDASDTRNAYLQDASYNIWGGGLLIPIPEPSTTRLILGGALFSAWLLRRRNGRELWV